MNNFEFKNILVFLNYQIKVVFNIYIDSQIQSIYLKYKDTFLSNESSKEDLKHILMYVIYNINKNTSAKYMEKIYTYFTKEGLEDYIIYYTYILINNKYNKLNTDGE